MSFDRRSSSWYEKIIPVVLGIIVVVIIVLLVVVLNVAWSSLAGHG